MSTNASIAEEQLIEIKDIDKMNNYTIYCTEEQTKKALKLGAPIIKATYQNKEPHVGVLVKLINKETIYDYICPTAEEMIGWLESQKEIDYIEIAKGNYVGYGITWEYTVQTTDYDNSDFRNNFKTRKEATWSAIDAALEYLEKIRKG